MKNERQNRSLRTAAVVFALLCCTVVSSPARAQASSGSAPQSTPNGTPANPQKPKPQQEANPFPEDTNSVPVLPSKNATDTAAPDSSSDNAALLPSADSDPVHSPDDGAPAAEGSSASSSSAGLDNLLKPPPDTDQSGKHRKLGAPEETHSESAAEDESVGSYYLDQKNWKAALSRFESALVLDPDNPDVYWGLAESQRHLGNYANARANYLKVTEFDPDSKHGKEAKKLLKDPELANAKAVSANAGGPPQQQ